MTVGSSQRYGPRGAPHVECDDIPDLRPPRSDERRPPTANARRMYFGRARRRKRKGRRRRVGRLASRRLRFDEYHWQSIRRSRLIAPVESPGAGMGGRKATGTVHYST